MIIYEYILKLSMVWTSPIVMLDYENILENVKYWILNY